MRRCGLLTFWILSVLPLKAQMPSECLLIINGRSLEAMQIAHTYAEARNFPAERILVLQPPVSFFRTANFAPRWTVPLAQAEKELLRPVLERLKELNDPSPTALLLSPDWPTRVSVPDSPELSITTYLSCAGNLPAGNLIKSGQALSPWFSEPPDTPQKNANLLRYPLNRSIDPPFYPAAMLGVFYPPQSPERIRKDLLRSIEGDTKMPVGSIVFETNADVRTRTRLAQYERTADRLRERGIDVKMLSATDPLPKKIIGVMGGAAKMHTARYRGKLQPGAYADHLTSHAATFDLTIQTKLTEWLDAGAAASSGTVTEPYAIWTKFPEAAVFERVLKGNTLLEALMQSVASPFQLLIVGDPLSRPWGEQMKKLDLKTEWKEGVLKVKAVGAPPSSSTAYHLFADGKRIEGPGPEWQIPFNAESIGPDLELILHSRYLWAPPQLGTVKKRITTPVPGKLRLRGSVKTDHVVLETESEEPLLFLEIYRGVDQIHQLNPADRKNQLTLGLNQSGTGPVTLRAKAVTRTGQILWSNSLQLIPTPPPPSAP
ncbi:MAG: TIGR03790 family protein [Kiritimatiellia bacterium]